LALKQTKTTLSRRATVMTNEGGGGLGVCRRSAIALLVEQDTID
jgi:hypothetical protein